MWIEYLIANEKEFEDFLAYLDSRIAQCEKDRYDEATACKNLSEVALFHARITARASAFKSIISYAKAYRNGLLAKSGQQSG
jgi:hypothetical protein